MSSEPVPALDPARAARVKGVHAAGIWKEFAFFPRPLDRAVEWATLGRVRRHRDIVALADVSFDLEAGGALGLIGANGAGKSTLLRLVCGTLYATRGRLEVEGRVGALLELGVGFHPEFTGRQNALLNARLLGLGDDEIAARLADIHAFSELGDDLDRPLRTWSSGMQLRLAFAVAAHVDPALLVVDEVLAVGDAAFTQKCIRRIRKFRADGVGLLFASHDQGALRTLCDEALLLHRGRVLDQGRPDGLLEAYNRLIVRGEPGRELVVLTPPSPAAHDSGAGTRSGNFRAVITGLSLTDAAGRPVREVVAGDAVRLTLQVACLLDIEDLTLGILLRDRHGQDVYGTNTWLQRLEPGPQAAGTTLEASFDVRLDLGPGEYTVTAAAHTLDTHVHEAFDWIDRVLAFRVLPPPLGFIGTAYLKPVIAWHAAPAPAQAAAWAALLAPVFGAAPRELRPGREAQPWLLAGWQPPETTDGSSSAWTAPECAALLDLRGARLEIEALLPALPGGSRRVVVEVFGRPLGERDLAADGQWHTLDFPLPRALQCTPALVRLRTPAWVPRDSGLGDDDRRLGCRVRALRVSDAGGAAHGSP